MRRALLLSACAGLALLLAACGGGDEPSEATPTPSSTAGSGAASVSPSAAPSGTPGTDASPTPTSTGTSAPGAPAPPPPAGPAPQPPAPPAVLPRSIRLEPALDGRRFERPVELGAYPGNRVFVAEQAGTVTLYRLDGAPTGMLLDIRGQVSRAGNEEGFLSFALDPAFPSRPYVYAYYSVAGGERRTRLSRFEVANDSARDGSELVILEQPQPFSNHNGGAIRFGPDGLLYLGFGDGGSQRDPSNNGQNLGTWLGKIIRIDVFNARPGATYVVPSNNPFASTSGARPEVWAYGLRNPWRMTFDPATGQLWVADVGQNAFEEIDIIERGQNYGWARFEGNDCLKGPCDTGGLAFPVTQYGRSEGCSVSGGVVYRGASARALVGWYLYADFCSGRIWAALGDGSVVQLAGAQSGRAVASFGTDEAGDVYLLVHGGALLKVVGAE